jgi:hypothetical protein
VLVALAPAKQPVEQVSAARGVDAHLPHLVGFVTQKHQRGESSSLLVLRPR